MKKRVWKRILVVLLVLVVIVGAAGLVLVKSALLQIWIIGCKCRKLI